MVRFTPEDESAEINVAKINAVTFSAVLGYIGVRSGRVKRGKKRKKKHQIKYKEKHGRKKCNKKEEETWKRGNAGNRIWAHQEVARSGGWHKPHVPLCLGRTQGHNSYLLIYKAFG